jgi:hypothetical protein
MTRTTSHSEVRKVTDCRIFNFVARLANTGTVVRTRYSEGSFGVFGVRRASSPEYLRDSLFLYFSPWDILHFLLSLLLRSQSHTVPTILQDTPSSWFKCHSGRNYRGYSASVFAQGAYFAGARKRQFEQLERR